MGRKANDEEGAEWLAYGLVMRSVCVTPALHVVYVVSCWSGRLIGKAGTQFAGHTMEANYSWKVAAERPTVDYETVQKGVALCAEVCTSLIRTLSRVRTANFSDYPKTSQLLSQLVEAVSVTSLGRSFIHVGTCALNRNIEGMKDLSGTVRVLTAVPTTGLRQFVNALDRV